MGNGALHVSATAMDTGHGTHVSETLDLRMPKLREGSYFLSLLEPRWRSERVLLAVVQQVYVEGVSTRRVDDLEVRTKTPCCEERL